MNGIRLLADFLHLLSILLLLYKIIRSKNCSGVSLKTIELYLIVFVTRYLDLFFSFVSYYNTIMKLFFILSTAMIWFLMKYRYRASYDSKHDELFSGTKMLILIIPSAVCGILFASRNSPYYLFEIVWTFSLFLESIAILPQLFMLTNKGSAETLTAHYMFALGAYRALYLLNWIYRYFAEGYAPIPAWIAGIVQTALYADFFYHYLTK
jgi:ER lumen protein retaining receptor